MTLVELLVVIGIIAVLLGVLIPAAGRAREQARTVNCLANLRQLALAAHGYAIHGDRRYPAAQYSVVSETTLTHYQWDFTFTKPKGSGSGWTVKPGLLWSGSGLSAQGEVLRVQQCPSYEATAVLSSTDRFTGYNYNTSYIGRGQGEAIPTPARLTDVKRPEECVLFGDGGYAAGPNKYMRAPFPNPADATFHDRWAGTQAFRHLGRTNVVFADQHVATLTDRHTNTTPEHVGKVAARTGFLSLDNSLYDLE